MPKSSMPTEQLKKCIAVVFGGGSILAVLGLWMLDIQSLGAFIWGSFVAGCSYKMSEFRVNLLAILRTFGLCALGTFWVAFLQSSLCYLYNRISGQELLSCLGFGLIALNVVFFSSIIVIVFTVLLWANRRKI